MITNWETQDVKPLGSFRIFDMYAANRIHPRTGKVGEFYYLNSPEWVNIIPITPDNKIIFVEQYRHGLDGTTLELPAGLAEKNEESLLAAERECIEETGYVGEGKPILLGTNLPNPAFMNNACHSYVWFNCQKQFEQRLDDNEVIDIHLLSIDQVKNKILSGEINHSLVLSAFFYYSLKYNF